MTFIAIILLQNFMNILTIFHISFVLIFSMSSGYSMMVYQFANKEYGTHLGLHVFKKFGFCYVLSSVFVYILDFLVTLIG